MDFSGTIKITDLNDFLNPAEKCSVHNNMIHKSAQNTAKVTLSDCLACSGCITSAETVLISQQSVQTLQEKLDQGCEVTVSISQQSLLSISKRLGQSASLTGKLLSGALRKKGIFQVLSMDHARDAVLKAAFEEFWERFQSAQMPLLSSECPGWLCYALKKGDEKLVNFMSKVKTPMLVQRELKGVHGFHIAVMPCYDKKLEAVMENGVDLVLTTTELLEFCGELSEEGDFDDFFSSVSEKSSSLGYAEFIFHKTVKLLYGESSEVRFKSTVRRDVLEIEYKDLKFCIASGFQNIQNVIRSLKTGKCKYQYIEIMACPMGCLNGGGQFRTSREEVLALESVTSDYYKQTLEESPVINAERELKLLNTNKLKW
jgi:iron only hydrogenase large subunit-like protein